MILKKLLPSFVINLYHFFLAFLGAIFFGFPSKKLRLIGITGTNGKTTTVEMIVKILEEAGFKVAQISSIKFKIGNKEWPNKMRMTMPGRMFIQRFLKKAVKKGCQYAVIEVTSEGVKQFRHRFLNFQTAIFTNLYPEHIESHGSFENYRRAKLKFFKQVKNTHIINLDDQNSDYFWSLPAKQKIGYSLKTIKNLSLSPKKISFEFKGKKFTLNLIGQFNVYNALAAITFAQSKKIDLEICQKALQKIRKMPGRMEVVIEKPFKVIVDYAFVPQALEKVYQTLKKDFRPKQMICVFGACGGGRDKWKRPVLGKIARKYCEKIILTNEDPYDEDPQEIIDQIAKGAGPKAIKILDRRQAIAKALSLAQKGDLVIITGKGVEPSICVKKGRKIPWSDIEVVKEEFAKLKIKT